MGTGLQTLRDIPRKPQNTPWIPMEKWRFRVWIPRNMGYITTNVGSHGICKGERTPLNFGVK